MRDKTHVFSLTGFYIDTINGIIGNSDKDKQTELTPSNINILKGFVENPKKVLNHQEIIRFANTGRTVDDIRRTVRNHITQIRDAFIEIGFTDEEARSFIETVNNKGYRFNPRSITAKKYEPLEGLRECFRKCSESNIEPQNVDISIQMGKLMSQLIAENWDANDYFDGFLSDKIKYRVIINSPEAVSNSYKENDVDYLINWHRVSQTHRNFDVRVSKETIHERLFIVYQSNSNFNGFVNTRIYLYSINLADSKTKTIPIHDADNLHTCEFRKHWENAIPINDFYNDYVIGTSTWEKRFIQAYEEKESGNIQSFINILNSLSKEGYSSAQNRLACCFLMGKYVKQNFESALKLFNEAAANGSDSALLHLALLCWFGYGGVSQDYLQAVEYFHNLAKKDGNACFYLYLAYRDGLGVKKNSETAQRYRILAEKSGVTQQQFFDIPHDDTYILKQ